MGAQCFAECHQEIGGNLGHYRLFDELDVRELRK
jgi:hypothetical protein